LRSAASDVGLVTGFMMRALPERVRAGQTHVVPEVPARRD
jgi:hypothetical protein